MRSGRRGCVALPQALRAQLRDTALETAFARGQAMSLTEAVADALAQT